MQLRITEKIISIINPYIGLVTLGHERIQEAAPSEKMVLLFMRLSGKNSCFRNPNIPTYVSTQLKSAAIKHKFIGKPLKILTFHTKNTPVHWVEIHPIKQEYSLVRRKKFIGMKTEF